MNGDALGAAPFRSLVAVSRSRADEKDVEVELANIDAGESSDLDSGSRVLWKGEYAQRSSKRAFIVGEGEAAKRKVRLVFFIHNPGIC